MSSTSPDQDLGNSPDDASAGLVSRPDNAPNAGTFSYAANSIFQRSIYQECQAYLPDLKGVKTMTIVDYGCGPGKNWTHGLDMLLSKADEDTEYQVVLNDGVKNDWNEVVKVVESYRDGRRGHQEGRFVILPDTFYHQIMPDQSVDVGMAWSSFHWLENIPASENDIPLDEDFHLAWQSKIRAQGLADLTKLLRLRAREIKPGGHLLMVSPTTPASTKMVFWEAFSQVFRSLLDDGIANLAQWRAFRAPFFLPTDDDLRQVLAAVQDLWHLPVPWAHPTLAHPAWTALQASEKTSRDYNEYADGISGFFMALVRGTLVRALRCEEVVVEDSTVVEEEVIQHFTERFKESIVSESLRHKSPDSSWLVVRLVRKTVA